ncbi:endopeptidase [Lysobacter oculi]|uniref:Endopeptidase n=1 Tax=Solilutibacter oculi TaxID=2698682 RepID=A0A344J846_9GAMM|nr:M23 family metallopeptidase [Lysobacter oculi]AXA85206.1 endopeptidase [Lysobacter oculi]
MSEENRSPPVPEAPEPRVIERRVVERRGAGLFRQFLLFLVGLLVGANGVYYWMQRDAARSTAAASTPVATLPAPNATPASPTPSNAAPATIVVDPHGSEPPIGTAPPLPAPVAAPSGLVIPVQGIAATQLIDTFTQARGENRVHDAIDIMAPHGTPVLAVADGSVAKLFESKAGGTTLYQFDPSGRYVYYYAHLQGYAPGVVEGKALKQGEVIAYVGSTGNANPEGPHLHFAIGALTPEKKWWDYTAINPYPLLSGR